MTYLAVSVLILLVSLVSGINVDISAVDFDAINISVKPLTLLLVLVSLFVIFSGILMKLCEMLEFLKDAKEDITTDGVKDEKEHYNPSLENDHELY